MSNDALTSSSPRDAASAMVELAKGGYASGGVFRGGLPHDLPDTSGCFIPRHSRQHRDRVARILKAVKREFGV